MKNFLYAASLLVSEDCNLNCTYCFENKTRTSKRMTKNTAEQAIEFLIENAKKAEKKYIDVMYFGGEPLLNLDTIIHSFRYAVKRTSESGLQLRCTMVTNCTLFPEGYDEFIKEWYDTLGNVKIQLSIDGPQNVQDMYRKTKDGHGSSGMVEITLQKYRETFNKYNIPMDNLIVHGCINKQTLPMLYESYMYFRGLGFSGAWFMPIHEESWDDNDAEIFKDQIAKVSDYIYDECIKTQNLDSYHSYRSLSICRAEFSDTPCAAGKDFCTITADGDLYPCHQFYFIDKSTKLGNIFDGEDISKRTIYLEYGSENMFGDKPCHECGNTTCYRCIATNYSHNGNMLIGFPAYCKMSRIEWEARKALRSKLEESGLVKPTEERREKHRDESDVHSASIALKPVFESLDRNIAELNQKMNDIFSILESMANAMLEMNRKINNE